MTAADKFIPSNMSSQKHRLPWIDFKLKKLLKKKKRLYHQAKHTQNWTKYRIRFTQKECKRTFRKAEQNHVRNIIDEGLQGYRIII